MAHDLTAKVVHVLASLHVGDDPAGAAEVARRWFERGWELLGGPLRDMVDGHDPVLAASVAPRGLETFMLAETERPYTDRQWPQFLQELEQIPEALFEVTPSVPDESRPEFGMLLPAPRLPTSYRSGLTVTSPDAVSLVLKSRHELVFDGVAGEQRVIAFLKEMVSIRAVDYAEVSYGYGGTELTMLELDLPRSPRESVPAARSVLRGFSWVTVICAGIAAQLGGASVLAGTGAFFRVEQLPHGEVWVQATEHFDDWDDIAAGKVFAVLAPFLPPGTKPLSYSRHADSVRSA